MSWMSFALGGEFKGADDIGRVSIASRGHASTWPPMMSRQANPDRSEPRPIEPRPIVDKPPSPQSF